jgi:hypothetical protein
VQLQEFETVELSESEPEGDKSRESRRRIAALLLVTLVALALLTQGTFGGETVNRVTPNPPATQLIPFVTSGPTVDDAVGSVDA